eukprot:PITA_36500
MTNAKFEVEKFTRKNNFSLWKLKVGDVLVQQGLHKALDGVKKKPASMTHSDWEDFDAQALSTIRLCLADEVLFNIVEETSTTVKFQEEDKAITFLCPFPDSWDHFITSISLSTTESFEFDSVVGPLLAKEVRKKSNVETSALEAMVARGRSKERGEKTRGSSRSKSKGKKCKAKCWYCNKIGHLKKDCWKQKESDNPKKEENQVD